MNVLTVNVMVMFMFMFTNVAVLHSKLSIDLIYSFSVGSSTLEL